MCNPFVDSLKDKDTLYIARDAICGFLVMCASEDFKSSPCQIIGRLISETPEERFHIPSLTEQKASPFQAAALLAGLSRHQCSHALAAAGGRHMVRLPIPQHLYESPPFLGFRPLYRCRKTART